jgi:hypothetical protein|tara:strand:+ start:515 stop:703 length:189 start_codon:yes stop_codon:yes gene_type:complete
MLERLDWGTSILKVDGGITVSKYKKREYQGSLSRHRRIPRIRARFNFLVGRRYGNGDADKNK